MSTTTGVSLEELKRQRAALIAQGKELSTSKELGKIEQAIKVLQPDKYDAAQVASAQQNLKLINEPVVSGPGGATMPGTSSSASSGSGGGGSNAEVSALEKQLLDKQTALDVATKNLNDNPWYSEATRVGKLAKLNNIAQLEIGNIQNALSQKKQDVQQAFSNQMAMQQFALQQQQANRATTTATATKSSSTGGGTGGGTSTGLKITDSGVAKALTFVKKQDNILGGTADSKLSAAEIAAAVKELSESIGNPTLAAQLVYEAMHRYGYDEWIASSVPNVSAGGGGGGRSW